MVESEEKQEPSNATGVLHFEDFELDLGARTLTHDGERLAIQRKPLEVLIFLATAAPRMVTRDELLERFWSRAVNDEVLTRCISTIRNLLNDTEPAPRIIETHRAQGYRFIADLRASEPDVPVRQTTSAWPMIALAMAMSLLAVFIATRPDTEPEEDNAVIDRIAVLPIDVYGSSEEWLPVALSDQLMVAVSKIDGVTVVSSRGLDPGVDAQTAGRRLNVDALLAARLEPAGAGSRLSATLVSTDAGELIWTSSVETGASLTDSASVDSLVRQVANRLRPMLQLQEPVVRADPEAYRLYLKGRYYWTQRSASGLTAALDAYYEALAIDPAYLDPTIGAAETWLLLPLYGATPPLESVPRAKDLAESALEIDPQNGRAKAVLGFVAMMYDWDWDKAETDLRAAVALNPNDATAQQWLGELLCYRARFADCKRQFEIARDLDPLSPVLAMQQGSVFLYSARYDEAVATYREAISAHPDFAMARHSMGLAYAGLGQWQAAIDAYESARPELGLEIVGGPMAYALARRGDTDEALKLIREIESLAAERYVPPSKIAVAYVGLGDLDEAKRWFDDAIEARDDRLVYFAVDVHTRDLVDEPGFEDVVARLGF